MFCYAISPFSFLLHFAVSIYCLWHLMLYSHHHIADFQTSMNERTHFFIKRYLSHFILERVDVSVMCEKWVETGTDGYIDPTSSLDHSTLFYFSRTATSGRSAEWDSALLPNLGWGCSTGGRWGPQTSVCKPTLTLAFLSPANSTTAGTCLYSFITSTCFRFFYRLFIQVHLWLTARSRVNI